MLVSLILYLTHSHSVCQCPVSSRILFFPFKRQHTLFLTTKALPILCDNLSLRKKMCLFAEEITVCFYLNIVFQRKINKIQEIKIPPESKSSLLEESGCQQPPATGTSMVRRKRLCLCFHEMYTCYSNSSKNI